MTFQSKQVKCYINGQIGALEKQPCSILNIVCFWPVTWNVPSCFMFRGIEGG